MRKLSFLLVFFLLPLGLMAQGTRYVSALDLNLLGKDLPTQNPYERIDTVKYKMPSAVLYMCTHSTGLAVAFKTDSRNIRARWKTEKDGIGNNMTAIMAKGLDLYIKKDGQWLFAGVGRPSGNADLDTHQGDLVTNMDEGMKECLVYLPLWTRLYDLEIGVDSLSTIESLQQPFRHKIIVHGSSITHGASASRPGMAYPALLERQTGFETVNLGFSGNCTMQKEFAEYLAKTQADAFVFDAFSNPSAQVIRERFDTFVDIIRKAHPGVPLIFLQTIRREGRNFSQSIEKFESDKIEAASEVIRKRMKTDPDVYFIDPGTWTGTDHLSSQDGTHPTDLGFYRMTEIMRPEILRILKLYGIE